MSSQPISQFDFVAFNAVSMASNQNSIVKNIQDVDCYSVNAYWSGTSPVGTFYVYASNGSVSTLPGGQLTLVQPPLNDPSWVAVSQQAVSGNTGQFMINVEKAGYYYIYLAYVAGSGTGSLTATVAAKLI